MEQIYKNYVKMDCPHCGKHVLVVSVAEFVDKLEADVLFTAGPDKPDTGDAVIDWETADIEASMRYPCSECGKPLVDNLDELTDIVHTGKCNVEIV